MISFGPVSRRVVLKMVAKSSLPCTLFSEGCITLLMSVRDFSKQWDFQGFYRFFLKTKGFLTKVYQNLKKVETFAEILSSVLKKPMVIKQL